MSTVAVQPPHRVLGRLLPPQQRKSADELADQLDLSSGDRVSKRSAFWTMLVLAGVIATAGVIGNSTATVIGAMIIAPLATPIMGMAFGVVTADARVTRRSAVLVALGTAVVVAIGLVGSLVLPSTFNLLANPQVTSRTSPTLVDLAAAVATGFAGAVGLARRDVSDVLPGVAVAISLVPPLAVVGICLGQRQPALALGAFVLFASNVLAMVLAGTLVFAVAYAAASNGSRAPRRRSSLAIALLLALVIVPLAANTVESLLVTTWTARVDTAAKQWLSGVPDAQVLDVTFDSRTAVVDVLAPGDLPPTSTLVASLQGKVPKGVRVVVDGAEGRRTDAGAVP